MSGALLEKVSTFLGQNTGINTIPKETWTWTGSGPNWVYPLLTSISGNKSDRLIERTYKATTEKT
jgi:hypothetical protein